MTASLFPDLIPEEPETVEKLSAGRRLTIRQHADVERGRHPLGDHGATLSRELTEQGHTCGDCLYRTGGSSHQWPKCWWPKNPTAKTTDPQPPTQRYTNGSATDCRAWWPACTDWVATELSPVDPACMGGPIEQNGASDV